MKFRSCFSCFFFTLILFFSVELAFAQKVSVLYVNAPLSDVLKDIARQTNMKLAYSGTSVNLRQRVSISATNKDYKEVLDVIFANLSSVDYVTKNDKLFVIPKVEKVTVEEEITIVTVSGKVTDNEDNPLIGVTVVVAGSTNGTITDLDGIYMLQAPSDAALSFSYLGYISTEAAIDGRTRINVILSEDSKHLDEVVVIGYGSIRKSSLATSVAVVKMDELNTSASNLDQALIGHTPGVQIRQASGRPGEVATMRVRGVNSIYCNVEPLYVIDGFPTDKDPYLNPLDVASIDILKDAAAGSIYGSRAAGGVVLINTKRGINQKPRVELDYQFSMQQVLNKMDMMNAEELRQLHKDGYDNTYFDLLRLNNTYANDEECFYHSRVDDSNERRIQYAAMSNQSTSLKSILQCPDYLNETYDTDWQDELFSVAPMHRTHLSVSGGREDVKYMFSVGYIDQKGIIAPSFNNRLTSRLNLDMNVSRRFSIAVSSFMSYSKERYVHTDSIAQKDGIIMSALGMPPMYPAYNEDGSYAVGLAVVNGGIYNTFMAENPIALAYGRQEYYTRQHYGLNAELKYKIWRGLYAKVLAGTQFRNQIYTLYRPAETLGSGQYAAGNFEKLAYSKENRISGTDGLLEATINYDKVLKEKHVFNAVAGYSMQKQSYHNISTKGQGYTNDRVAELSGAGSTATDENGTSAVSNKYAWSLMSVFGRFMYTFDNRYTISTSIRSDGCSRFGKLNRWGYFPSVAVGWDMSQEDFFAPAADFMTLKWRASWGISGNNNIDNYRHRATISKGSYAIDNEVVTTYYPTGFTDQELGWEKTQQFNVGFDLGFFENRMKLIANYYRSITSNLLYSTTVSALSGSTSYWTNLDKGLVHNNGFDLQIDGSIISNKNFGWNIGANISLNRNKVMGLEEGILQKTQRSQYTHLTRNGLPIGCFYGMVSQGLITAEDYENIKIDKLHQGEKNYQLLGPPVEEYNNVYIGDVKWKDVDGDGKITANDCDVIGNNYPDFIYGINTFLRWKKMLLSITFDGQYGAEAVNFMRYYICNNEGGVNSLAIANNRYRNETTVIDENTMYRANRVAKNRNTKFSDYYIEDASFFRCSDISIGYTISGNPFLHKLHMDHIYIYGSVGNVFMLTDYQGYNPDVNNNITNNLDPGLDFGAYPLSRTYNIGIKLGF